MDLSITIILIVITSLVSLYTMQKPDVLYKLTMNPYMITQRGQYYRMLSSGFIHRDHMHLIFNMFSFYFFGTQLEYIFGYIFESAGPIYFVLLYLMGIVISDLPTLMKHRNNYSYNSLGASGAVSAVIFACILFLPLQDICLYGILCFPGFILGAVYLIYSYVSAKRASNGINHDAHLFGALFGIVYCVILYPDSVRIFLEQMADWKLF